jgi:hypothetical protein
VAPSEPWHEVGKAGEPQFENGCQEAGNAELGLATAFYKDLRVGPTPFGINRAMFEAQRFSVLLNLVEQS